MYNVLVRKEIEELKSDLKLTRPREVIAQKILSSKAGEHFTADELWEELRKKDKRVSRATVYRTLHLLVQKKMVEEHDFGKGEKYYERMMERPHHDHLICVHCGRIIEFENPQIERLQEEIARKENFAIAYHSHKLFGTCSHCRHRKRPASSRPHP
jgi:Fur family ferric uptake transcriptional regulator